eukprot:1157325-Pelagomonas_calceolata.AAC.1
MEGAKLLPKKGYSALPSHRDQCLGLNPCLQRVLGSEETEARMAAVGGPQLWDEHLKRDTGEGV